MFKYSFVIPFITVLDWTKSADNQCPPKHLATLYACLAFEQARQNEPGVILASWKRNQDWQRPPHFSQTYRYFSIKNSIGEQSQIGILAQLHPLPTEGAVS